MPGGKPLTSGQLATLIVDALVPAGIIKKQRLEEAIALGADEIDARKGVGHSYYPGLKETHTNPKRQRGMTSQALADASG